MFNIPPPDGSRDPRIDDPTNLWLVHPGGRLLLPVAVRGGVPANAVSIAGFGLGAAGAWCYGHWREPGMAALGFALTVLWLVADGLDGMIARATGTASVIGRTLDGICDHGVFALIYVALAWSIGTPQAWLLAVAAAAFHAVQATLYEGERIRFHRRIRREAAPDGIGSRANPLVRLYDTVAGSLDRLAAPFDRMLVRAEAAGRLAQLYGEAATSPLRLMIPLSNNMRVLLIFLACAAARDPRLFWWIELGPLSVVAAVGIVWHRRVEARLVREHQALV